MKYIYMNNFRGFSNTLIPLRKVNFLVGENSTGKSSFLTLLSVLNTPSFWLNATFNEVSETGFSTFKDIISAWSNEASFQVGIVTVRKDEKEKFKLSFSIHSFSEKDDVPKLTAHFRLKSNQITSFFFDRTRTKYKTKEFDKDFESESDAINEFNYLLGSIKIDLKNFKSFPKNLPASPPLPIALSILQSLESGKKIQAHEFKLEIPMGEDITWIAPIRSKPKRIYDGMKRSYSPEGEHAPLILRKTLRSKSGADKFTNSLAAFGKSSGLFETITAHSFGRGNQDPFELLIQFKGAELNIDNVGYGVSQVLPLIVEFLTTYEESAFAVQQPEVHLHPRAQAALGSLVFSLAHEYKHSFYIETHSDYLIDRYRLSMSNESEPPDSQVLFFMRDSKGNKAQPLIISEGGQYPSEQPNEFRDFFIKEEMRLLDI